MKIVKEKTKQNLKKIVAILCAITMLPLGTLATQKPVEGQAADTAVTNPDTLEKWTIADVGLQDGNYSHAAQGMGKSGTPTGTSMDQKAFVTNIVFPVLTKNNAYFHVGGQYLNDILSGLTFDIRPTGIILYHNSSAGSKSFGTIDPSKFELSTLLGQQLKLMITTEFVNNNGVTTDAKIGLYINDILYNNQYLELTSVPVDSLQQQVGAYAYWARGEGTTSIWLGTPVTPIDELERWDNTDVELNHGAYAAKTVQLSAVGDSLDKKAFVTKINFSDNSSTWKNTYFGINGTPYSNGVLTVDVNDNSTNPDVIKFYARGYGLEETLDLSQFNLDKIAGIDFELAVTTEFVNNNGTTTDVNIGLYINNVLYNNAYLILKNVPVEMMKQQVGVWAPNGGAITLKQAATPFEEFEPWGIADVGLSEGGYAAATNGDKLSTAGATLDKKVFITTVNFSVQNSTWRIPYLGINGKPTASGVLTLSSNDNAANADVVQFSVAGYGITETLDLSQFNLDNFAGVYVTLAITTEFVNNNGTTTDVNVGIYINDIPYNKSFVLKDMPLEILKQQIGVWTPNGGTITLKQPVTSIEKLKQWTIEDVGLESRAYGKENIPGRATGMTQDGTAFRANVTFPANTAKNGRASTLFIGNTNTTNTFKGYCFQVSTGNTLRLLHYGNGETTIHKFDATEKAAILGKEVTLTLTTEFFNNDGTTTDVKVGLYIDGVLHGGTYKYMYDKPVDCFSQEVYIWNRSCEDNATLTVTAPTLTAYSTKDEGISQQVLDAEGYTLASYGKTTVNGVERAKGSKLEGIGDYRVVTTLGNQVTAQTVILWKTGAINSDGAVDVKDLIAFKKMEAAGTDVLSRAVRKGADVDASGTINAADHTALQEVLIGKR